MGGFESVFMRYKLSDPLVTDAYVHNDYLQFLIELGMAGFIIGAVLFVCLGRTAIRAASHVQDTDARCVAVACIGAFTAIGMHSFVDFNLYIPANAMLLAWISGICASLDVTTEVPAGGSGTRRKEAVVAL
jgi:O-antigen ligase